MAEPPAARQSMPHSLALVGRSGFDLQTELSLEFAFRQSPKVNRDG